MTEPFTRLGPGAASLHAALLLSFVLAACQADLTRGLRPRDGAVGDARPGAGDGAAHDATIRPDAAPPVDAPQPDAGPTPDAAPPVDAPLPDGTPPVDAPLPDATPQPDAAPPTGGAHYGPGLAADALNNTRIGSAAGYRCSYRFRAHHTGALASFRPYLVWSYNKPGYHEGTGGILRFELQPDDGTAEHHPGNTVLAAVDYPNPLSGPTFPQIAFNTAATVQARKLYHLVVTNVDADPVANYVSTDHLFQYKPPTPVQPTLDDVDWAELIAYTGSTWQHDNRNTPILALYYADGTTEGMGYMEVWVGNPKPISGSSAVRELFTVSGADRSVTGLHLRLTRASGSDPLTVTVERSDGTPVVSGTIAAAAVPTADPGWVSLTFAQPHALSNGTTYHLLLTAPASSTYEAYPIRQGGSYDYPANTYFSDGYAQYTSSSGWVGWDMWGAPDRKEQDLQFYFDVAP